MTMLARGRRPTQQAVLSYGNRFVLNSHSEIFIMGNAERATALLYARPLIVSRRNGQIPTIQSMRIPVGRRVYSRRNSNPVDHNSVAQFCAQTGSKYNLNNMAMNLLTASLYKQRAYDQLRTVEQLGYIVFGFAYAVNTVTYLCVLVVSPGHSAAYLTDRISLFFRTFKRRTLDRMSSAAFAHHKGALIAKLTARPLNIGREISKFQTEISNRQYIFNRQQQLANIVRRLTLPQIQRFYTQSLMGPQRRVLNIQITSSIHPGAVPANSTWARIPNIASFRRAHTWTNVP